ncbi:FAD-dependent oxidoreductase [Achromobacter aloeverae]|uniref:Pyridine nucleotide-disulfide oxidoreductase n=1 Tax=Achromobacter aloeverae TaxID=1750518 RepID=A0A4Q1HG57_9BURK|nr:FAD-dependent oxidoreductase [Achromobacter aloeverae]RXN86143.1 pyridine nucleotide-disulfide oxidoreductase [Achromobacter aloeverae]
MPTVSTQHVHTAIIGAGHGGVECAWALRAAGIEDGVMLFGAEPHAPYERPPLSKSLLTGGTSADRIALRAGDAYEKSRIDFASGDPVVHLDTAQRVLHTRAGRRVGYRHCVLATGAGARAIAGLDGEHVHAVRGLDDAHRLREAIRPGRRLLVVGAGYLGLEAACSARKLGAEVRVLEQQHGILPGRVSAATAERMSALHRDAGIDIRHGVTVAAWRHVAGIWRASLADGGTEEAELVLVSIGAVAATTLAEAAGLACRDGVVVDAQCRASAPDVYAIGDCASAYREELQRHARIESVQNALMQARIVAAVIAGTAVPAAKPPTFWSEQHGRRLQMAGLVNPALPCRDILHTTARGWLVERYQQDRLAAVEAVDSPVEFIKGVPRIGTPQAYA